MPGTWDKEQIYQERQSPTYLLTPLLPTPKPSLLKDTHLFHNTYRMSSFLLASLGANDSVVVYFSYHTEL